MIDMVTRDEMLEAMREQRIHLGGMHDKTLAELKRVRLDAGDYMRKQEAEIERLRAQLATARKALEPFAAFSKYVTENRPGWDHDDFYFAGEVSGFMPRMKAFRAARAALNSGEQKQIEDWPYPEGNPTCAQDLK